MSSSPARSRAYRGRHRVAGPAVTRPAGAPTRAARAVSKLVPSVAATALTLTAAGAAVATAQQHPGDAPLGTGTGSAPVLAMTLGAAADGGSVAGSRQAQLEDTRATARASRSVARGQLGATAAAAAAKAAAQRWVLPVRDYRLSSKFGYRWGRLHAGVDFAAKTGTKLVSMSTGTVVFAGWQGGYGNKVEIRYWDGTVSYFGHMSRIAVKKGQRVAPGQAVGLSGNTGRSTGPHLHLEIHPGGGKPVNPLSWLTARGVRY